MARKNFKIPLLNKTISAKDAMWYALGGIGAAALYFILANRDTGFAPIDAILEPIGDITGLEGQGSVYLPQFFGPAANMPSEAPIDSIPTPTQIPSSGDYRFTNAYQAGFYGDGFDEFGDFRFSNVYSGRL